MQRGQMRDSEEWPSARRESSGSLELEFVFAALGFAGHVRERRSVTLSGEFGWEPLPRRAQNLGQRNDGCHFNSRFLKLVGKAAECSPPHATRPFIRGGGLWSQGVIFWVENFI